MNRQQTNWMTLWTRLCLTSSVFAVCACLTPLRAQNIVETDKDGVVTVQENGQPMLEYRSLPSPMKVYLSKWFTPQGTQVLRDSPHDHVHHHALMYAIGIDDCDFWSEVPEKDYGKQIPASEASVTATSSGDHCQVVIKQAINWVNTQGQVLAVEAREITALRGEVKAASLLTWSTTLTPTEAKPEVELWGSHYFGLGMRFVESMDKEVTFVTPGNETGTVVRGSEKLTRATWCALRAKADGKPVTIAMFDAPGNPRHPATWFTMTAFTYLSATLDLGKEKMTISRDQPLQVKYGVAAWDGEVDKAEIERVYQVWLQLP